MTPEALGHLEVWLVTGSQEMYGPATLRQVEAHAREIAAGLDAQPDVPVRVVYRDVATSPGSIRRAALDANAAETCIGVIAWMHTFSPAKMWIAGLSALQKPLLHLHTQFNRDLPWAEIDMDFMNLNQSAHGDREFGFIETRMRLRRKTVVGHWRDPEVARAHRRLGARGRRAGTRRSRSGSPASATTCARSRSPRATRSRRRSGWAWRSTATASDDLARRGRGGFRGRGRPSRRGVRGCVRPRSGSARRRRRGASRCATRRGSRPACAGSSTRAGSGRSPTPSRTSGASRSCRASQRSG